MYFILLHFIIFYYCTLLSFLHLLLVETTNEVLVTKHKRNKNCSATITYFPKILGVGYFDHERYLPEPIFYFEGNTPSALYYASAYLDRSKSSAYSFSQYMGYASENVTSANYAQYVVDSTSNRHSHSRSFL
jgi:hypothetical protein